MSFQIHAQTGRKTALDIFLAAVEKYQPSAMQPIELAASEATATPRAEPPQNPAVTRCILAYNQAHRAALAEKQSPWESRNIAARAYRAALPSLSGRKNIRDFIACVAYAMVMEIVGNADGAQLISVARTAHAIRDKRPHRKKIVESAPPSEKSAPFEPQNTI